MTDLECFRATVAHERPERVLHYFSCTPDLLQRLRVHAGIDDIDRHYGMLARRWLGLKKPAAFVPPDYSAYWRTETLPPGTTINGMGVAQVPSGFYHFWGYVSPLRTAQSLAELERYPLTDVRGWDGSHLRAETEQAHAEGRVVVGSVGHIYENAWQIRGYVEFLTDILERPAWAQCLIDRLAEQNMARAVAFARAGADMLHCGDDIASQNAMMFHPAIWRRMLLSRWREIWQAAKAIHPDIKVWYHSDGNIIDVVDDLVEAGVDILNPLQPECLDIDAIHQRHGARLTFDGCIGTQSTMPFGTPAEVRARVREVVGRYGRNGGLIVSPTHVLEPEVPVANIEALADACRQAP